MEFKLWTFYRIVFIRIDSYLILLLFFIGVKSYARDWWVKGHFWNGASVSGHHRTTPDRTVTNTYGTRGNMNPYTGASGTRPRNPYQPPGSYNPSNRLGD